LRCPVVMRHNPSMSLDAAIMLTATLAALACTVPGVWLVLRRQSMMGDALSHTALPGLVIAFLAATALHRAGWLPQDSSLDHLLLLGGAAAAGLATAWLTEWLQGRCGVEANTALGVVFTALFALGLFLVRFAVDDVHLDTDCVLFGRVVEVALNTQPLWGWEVPRAAVVNGAILVVNLVLQGVCFKELQIAAFDPEQATAQGISARAVHYAQMAVTAVTAVAVFETAGSILVVALLVVPAATAQLLTDRLKVLVVLALAMAAASAIVGHELSQRLPAAVFGPLGWSQVEDASTSGMIAVTAGIFFLTAWVVSPRRGLLIGAWNRTRLRFRILAEDVMGALYRQQERRPDEVAALSSLNRLVAGVPLGRLWNRLLLRWFTARGLVVAAGGGYRLTPLGLETARKVVRGHRLWETYLGQHFDLPADHLDSSAHRAEHFLDDELRNRLAQELHAPQSDPHGSRIPPAEAAPGEDGESRQTPSERLRGGAE
jgi:manganese/zinc/iron transport system permease protein